MIDVPPQWTAILAVGFSIRTAVEVIRHWQAVRGAVLLVALAAVIYFGVDPVAMLGWGFNKTIPGAVLVKAAFNTLLLAGATMEGHDLLKRVSGA